MNRMFKHQDAAPADPIIFETITSEKPGGGLVKNPEFDLKPGRKRTLRPNQGIPPRNRVQRS